jgi:hypothetical protein
VSFLIRSIPRSFKVVSFVVCFRVYTRLVAFAGFGGDLDRELKVRVSIISIEKSRAKLLLLSSVYFLRRRFVSFIPMVR